MPHEWKIQKLESLTGFYFTSRLLARTNRSYFKISAQTAGEVAEDRILGFSRAEDENLTVTFHSLVNKLVKVII